MDHVSRMQIVHSKANMDEDLPKEVVSEWFAILFLDSVAEIAVLTVLHHDANSIRRRDKAVKVSNHEVWIDLRHNCHLLHGRGRLFNR